VCVDKIGALRLEIGDLRDAQLAGRAVDVGRLVTASEQLEALIQAHGRVHASRVPGPGEPCSPAMTSLRAKLADLLGVDPNATPEEMAQRELSENEKLRAENTRLHAELTELKAAQVYASTRTPPPPPAVPAHPPGHGVVVPMRTSDRTPAGINRAASARRRIDRAVRIAKALGKVGVAPASGRESGSVCMA
jgi:hypothetical protein